MKAKISEFITAELLEKQVIIRDDREAIELTLEQASKLRIALEAFERKMEDKQ